MPSAPRKRGHHRGVLDDLLGAADPAPGELLPSSPPLTPSAPSPRAARASPPATPAAAGRAAPVAPPAAAATQIGIRLPPGVIDRARDVVYHTPGLTLSGLVAAAITGEIRRLERQRGQPFPARRTALRTGRPVR